MTHKENLARSSLPAINDLLNSINGLHHVEENYLRSKAKIEIKQMDLPPLQKELDMARLKVNEWMENKAELESWSLTFCVAKCICDWDRQYQYASDNVEKMLHGQEEVEGKISHIEEEIREQQNKGEKYADDARSLDRYRTQLKELFDPIFEGLDDVSEATKDTKEEINKLNEEIQTATTNKLLIPKVEELLREAELSLMEQFVLMQQAPSPSMGDPREISRVFPPKAYESIRKAREIYPTLPPIVRPDSYENPASIKEYFDSPKHHYIWEVRKSVLDVLGWCQDEMKKIVLESTDAQIKLGDITDRWLAEQKKVVEGLAKK